MKIFYKGVCTDLGDPIIDGEIVHLSWLSEVKALTNIKDNIPVDLKLKKFKGISTESGKAFDKDGKTYIRHGITNGPILCYKVVEKIVKKETEKLEEKGEVTNGK